MKLWLLLAAIGAASSTPGPIVEVPNGRIEGVYATFEDGTYMQFEGIPYAQPPIGQRRFAPPQPRAPWTGTWIANTSHTCIQIDHHDDGVTHAGDLHGSEDCLYLNVLTPGETINPEGMMDVIVHIHGGGFMFGSPTAYALPKPFMDREVVFVTMSYRLGILGFMSLEDSHLPGNLGMKDQVAALEWIRDNIAHFGGNPASVTITGLSAGGASVHFHMLSPMSRGLFHRAISASGNALDPWAIYEAPRQKAKRVGEALGCNYKDSEAFLGCLRSRSAEQIVEVTKQFREWVYLPFSPFGLTVDYNAKVPFLPEHPYKLLERGKINDVPWLVSLTSGEGLYPVAQLAYKKDYFDILEKNFDRYLPPLLHYDMAVPEKRLNDVTTAIRKEYLNGGQVSLETYPKIIQMASDRLFNIGMEKSIRLYSKTAKSPVYFYFYDYIPEKIWSLPDLLFGIKEKYGVSHADDMLMIFDAPMEPSKNDAEISEFLRDTWVEFAKTGRTGPDDWKALSHTPTEPIDYLYIGGPDKIEMRKTQDLGNKEFWNSLPFIENENLFRKEGKYEL